MGGFLGDKALELFKEAMEDYGIEPGELYRTIDKTLGVIDEMAPQIQRMEEISDKLDEDVGDLREEIRRFNDNTEDLTEALESNAETMEKFADIMQDISEMEE